MEERKLKLNKKNTFFIGLAFFAILMLWQVYNTYCPIILEELLKPKFEDENRCLYIVGIIMALDNVAALILMPIVGNLSDRTKTKKGKRMPYILIGMIASAIAFPLIAMFYLLNTALGVILSMGLVLIIMQCYRSPAVALMPDVTPKPLRSTANGIINLVGYLGAVLAAVLAMIFKKSGDEAIGMTALWPFVISSVLMLAAMIFLNFKINEPKILEETKDDIAYGETMTQAVETEINDKKLGKRDVINLFLLLGSVFCWFMAFNAVETFNSLFCTHIIGTSGIHGTFTIILTVSSILTFILCSGLSDKIGRKWTVVLGLILLICAFLVIGIFSYGNIVDVGVLTIIIYICSAVLGVGWALVNINSYPMIVELSSQETVGKFTGYYYIASMAAQVATPIIIGLIMSFNDAALKLLYLYSSIFMSVALIIFIFVIEKRDLKRKSEKKGILERIGDMDD